MSIIIIMTALLLLFILIFTAYSILDRQYYNVLHVPISAGPEQIKQAFRKLSRKYHPDRNPNSRKKFQKINVAYETLSNQNRKYLYDRLGHEKMDDPNIQQQKNVASLKGPSLQVNLIVSLEDLYKGKQIVGTIFKRTVCPHCLGSGAQNDYDIVRCSQCNGQGRTTERVHVGGGYYNMMTKPCPRCSGKGKIVGRKCSTCSGNRIIPGNQDFKIRIKPGYFSGELIRYTNMAEELEEGAPGDLFIRITQARHSRFVRQGHNLRTQITISLRQALLGFKRTVKQLDGRELQIQRNQITQPGQYLTIEGEGMPITGTEIKGIMIVKVNVVIPDYSEQQLGRIQNLLNEINK